jgi:hypothetical protein
MKKDDLAEAYRLNTIQTIRVNAKLNVMIADVQKQIDLMMQQEIADQFDQSAGNH